MYLGIDIGGTKTLIGVFSDGGELKSSLQFPTPADYQEFLEALATKIVSIDITNVKATCVAVPGKIDRANGRSMAYGNLKWGEQSIQHDLADIIKTTVVVENDANLAGLFEANQLKHEHNKVLYITISTGIGSGFIVNGIIDPNFADAEVGQLLLEHDGKLQRWEEFASGKAITKMYGKKASEISDKSAWYLIARNIAIGIIDLIATLTPDIIIIGGGVGANLMKFEDRLSEELKIFTNDLLEVPPIKVASRPEEAVIYGCYLFAKSHIK